jgi:hypothetical protein
MNTDNFVSNLGKLIDNEIIDEVDFDYNDQNNQNENLESFDNSSETINNVFYFGMYGSNLKIIENKELYKRYNNTLYVLCLNNDVNPNITELQVLFDKDSTIDHQYMSQYLSLLKTNMNVLKNRNHKRTLVVLDNQSLSYYNKKNYNLTDNELVLCIFDLNKKNVKLYLDMINNDNNLEKYVKSKIIADYLTKPGKSGIVKNTLNLNDNILSIVKNMADSNYWKNNFNCNLNMTEAFNARGFKVNFELIDFKSVKNKDELISALKKLQNFNDDINDYLKNIYKKAAYVDASSAINKDNIAHYRMQKLEDLDFTKDEIIELFRNLKQDQKEIYYLYCYLLISKKYCHLMINNTEMFEIMQPTIDKYYPVFRYLFGYAWLVLSLEESVKKTHTLQTDRYVFDIDTASKLPFFPYCSEDIHVNPYISLLVASDVLDTNNNFLGLSMIDGYQYYGISNLEQFKRNLRIFTSGTSPDNVSILDGLNWNNIAVTGSAMTACIPKKNPLTMLFEQNTNALTDDEVMLRYFREYYTVSDIDVMCNLTSMFEYIDKVNDVYTTVKSNLLKIHKDKDEDTISRLVRLVPTKTAAVFVNIMHLKKRIESGEIPHTLEYILANKDTNEIKEIFYLEYIAEKKRNNDIDRKKVTNPENKNRYDPHYKFVSMDEMSLVFICYDINKWTDDKSTVNQYHIKNESPKSDVDKLKEQNVVFENNPADGDSDDGEEKEDNTYYMKIGESLKFKIESSLLEHSFEIFQIKFPDFFSCVARFHLPCVRAYYNGSNTYILPSAITSYQTFMNVNYKYFAGAKDPMEILDKNRMRGFGTFLNSKEKIQAIEYSHTVTKWNKLYKLNLKSKKDIERFFSPCKLNDSLFRPRRENSNLFVEMTPVNDFYMDHHNVNYLNTLDNVNKYYSDKTGKTNNYTELRTIGKDGSVLPVKTWVIDAVYDTFA